MIVIAIIIFVLIIGFEVPRMLQQKMYRELAVFTVLTIFGMVWMYGYALDIPLPKITDPLEMVFRPVYLLLEELLVGSEAA